MLSVKHWLISFVFCLCFILQNRYGHMFWELMFTFSNFIQINSGKTSFPQTFIYVSVILYVSKVKKNKINNILWVSYKCSRLNMLVAKTEIYTVTNTIDIYVGQDLAGRADVSIQKHNRFTMKWHKTSRRLIVILSLNKAKTVQQ